MVEHNSPNPFPRPPNSSGVSFLVSGVGVCPVLEEEAHITRRIVAKPLFSRSFNARCDPNGPIRAHEARRFAQQQLLRRRPAYLHTTSLPPAHSFPTTVRTEDSVTPLCFPMRRSLGTRDLRRLFAWEEGGEALAKRCFCIPEIPHLAFRTSSLVADCRLHRLLSSAGQSHAPVPRR